jgi:DNA-binding MarR family transcriptional regulator
MSSNPRRDHGGGNLGYLMRRAQLAFRSRMDDGLKALKITAPQYAVLSSLAIEPGISNAALARVAFVTPQSMLGIVANLERLGLLERVAAADHGRILEARLTEKGRSTLMRAHKIAGAIESEMIGDVGVKDVEKVRLVLTRFATNLGG